MRRLRGLNAKGRPITIAAFPHAEHGIYEYETKADGTTRVSTRNSEGYFYMMRDYIFIGDLKSKYGMSTVTQAR